jgi:hypothetical protein
VRVTAEQLQAEVDRVAQALARAGLPVDLELALLLMAAELIETRTRADGSKGFTRCR